MEYRAADAFNTLNQAVIATNEDFPVNRAVMQPTQGLGPYAINLKKLNKFVHTNQDQSPREREMNESYQIYSSKNRSIDEACNQQILATQRVIDTIQNSNREEQIRTKNIQFTFGNEFLNTSMLSADEEKSVRDYLH